MKARLSSSRWVPPALGAMVILIGLAQLCVALFPGEAGYLRRVEPWTPFHIHFGSRVLLLVTGLSLTFLGRAIRRRKKAAWWLAVGALAAGPVLHLGLDFSWRGALASALPLALLLRARRHFVARSDAGSLRRAGWLAAGAAVALLGFGWVVLERFRIDLAGRHDLLARLQVLAELVFLQSSDTLVARTAEAQTALYAISAAGAALILLVVIFALRPVVHPPPPDALEIERVRRLLQTHGRDPLDEFALASDKRHFFTASGRGLVSFALWRNFALTLADPVGPPEERAQAIREFTAFCTEQDWEPVFYEIGEGSVAACGEAGFTVFKIGECATIPLAGFALTGKKFQDLRTARSRAAREGVSIRWLPAGQPPPPEIARELREVSDGWLARKKGGEMAFDMGAYSEAEITARGAVLAVRDNGRVEAFATWLPYAGGTGRCIDLMRARPEIPGVMDFVIVESLLRFQAEGLSEASLANAPLANVRPPDEGDSRHDKAVRYIYENFNRLYGYKHLFQFKKKYAPVWSGRYLAYRHRRELPLVACAMAAVHIRGGLRALIFS